MLAPLAYIYVLCALLLAPALGDGTASIAANSNNNSNMYTPASDGVVLGAGKQTSCAVALVSAVHGIAAANCLVTKNGTAVSPAGMTIAMYGSSVSQVVAVSSVVIHPGYDPKTLANNVAVVMFSITGSAAPVSNVSLTSSAWDDSCLLRRTLLDPARPRWNNPLMARLSDSGKDLCLAVSPLYAANQGDFICNNLAALPDQLSATCKLPYGLGYGAIKDQGTVPMAIYSHTVVVGNSLCSTSPMAHYYTVLKNYMAWASQTAADQAKSLAIDTGKYVMMAAGNTQYQMKPPANPSPVVKTFGGNLYRYLSSPGGSVSSTPPGPTTSPTSPTSPTSGGPSYSTTTVYSTTFTIVTTYLGSYKTTPAPGQTLSCSDLTGDDTYDCTETVTVDGTDDGVSFSNVGTLVPLPTGSTPTTNTGPTTSSSTSTGPTTSSSTSTGPTTSSSTSTGTDTSTGTRTDTDTTTTSTDSTAPNKNPDSTGGISNTTKVLIGVLVPIAIIVILLCVYFYWRRERR
ncbi:hypothetical protein H4R18_003376 [Coemansia javaensis]|uniref:Peptidase S1 domain-containing protein n=1 Tax=Coemansia javaensis TaxID=2761396 RepID=A0A9W8H9B4_9FUNG|nr:hypothetical protein H4R18_003376 [Coemansia javaensis]